MSNFTQSLSDTILFKGPQAVNTWGTMHWGTDTWGNGLNMPTTSRVVNTELSPVLLDSFSGRQTSQLRDSFAFTQSGLESLQDSSRKYYYVLPGGLTTDVSTPTYQAQTQATSVWIKASTTPGSWS